MPTLKDKQMFLKDMDEQAARKAQGVQAAQGMQELQLRGAEVEVAETESKAALNVAKARQAVGATREAANSAIPLGNALRS